MTSLHRRHFERGLGLAALSLLLGLFMVLHARIPNRIGNLGSLVETFLPWFGLLIPVLLGAALLRRSASAAAASLLPVMVWLNLFGGMLIDKSQPGSDLTVASHNVAAANPDPAGTARDLAASGADVLALEELTPQAASACAKELATTYRYHTVQGTVGLWSKLPLSRTRPVDLGMDATRALRTTVSTDHGPLAVYVAHLGSVRVFPRSGLLDGAAGRRGTALAAAVAAERNQRVVLLGDLNGSHGRPRLRRDHLAAALGPGRPGTASASPGRRGTRWRGSTRSWSAASSRGAPGCCRPPAATTGRWPPQSAGEPRTGSHPPVVAEGARGPPRRESPARTSAPACRAH